MSEYIVRMPPDMPYEIKAELNAWYVNSEPIVRCRDCCYADEIEGGYWCDRFDNGKEHVTPNGFCAWAERRGMGK